MNIEEKFKALFASIRELSSSERNRSKLYNLPDDMSSRLNEIEEYMRNVSDKVPQKKQIINIVQRSRGFLADGNIDELRYHMWRIDYRYYDDLQDNILIVADNEKYEETSKINSKSGKAPKRRIWADLMAKELVKRNKNIKYDTVWESIPDSFSPIEIETDAAMYEVYRDGNKIIGRNTTNGNEQELTKLSFEKKYYREAKKPESNAR
jgi:hypothetical protein